MALGCLDVSSNHPTAERRRLARVRSRVGSTTKHNRNILSRSAGLDCVPSHDSPDRPLPETPSRDPRRPTGRRTPVFLDRMPDKLRGGEIYAVEAQDHYLRLHTSRGQDLILMRLADALGELEGLEGAQVHRSWWVAKTAIAQAARGNGRATITLKNGAVARVSRTYARALREAGWI